MLDKQTRNRYRRLLEDKERALLADLRRRDGIAISERIPDLMDEILSSNDRDLAISTLDREAGLLREVRAALESLGDGAYGICSACETIIPARRLNAVPWTRLCVVCQDEADRSTQEEEPVGVGAASRRAA